MPHLPYSHSRNFPHFLPSFELFMILHPMYMQMIAETIQLVLLKSPISVTLGLFDNIFMTDPNSKEEEIMRGRITCAIAEDDSICLITQVSRTFFLT